MLLRLFLFIVALVVCRPPTKSEKMKYSDFLLKAEASMTQKDLEVEHFYLQLADFDANTFA